MAIGSWKTRAVFDRCNIVDERDIKAAAHKLHTYLDERHTIGTQAPKEAEGLPTVKPAIN